MTDLRLSLYYNYKDGPAFPDAPELGNSPHAQTAMRHLGITYKKAVPQSLGEQWWFLGCENVPETLPKWLKPMTLSDEDRLRWGQP